MTERLTDDAVRDALTELTSWELVDGKLRRELRFANFSEALGFLVRVGIEAEKRDHHPELTNVYSRVTIDLTTHDAGGISEKDVDLARAIDALADA
jgi:4a-hydroxytetrahydrobiopterin dehydratase